MNEEILKLAKECGAYCIYVPNHRDMECRFNTTNLEAFYRAAFNAGLEAAANKCNEIGDDWLEASDHISENASTYCAAAIRALKEQP